MIDLIKGPFADKASLFKGATLIVFAVFIFHGPAIFGGYIWDDDKYVTDNLTLRSGQGLAKIWSSPTKTPQYYPLVFTSFWIEHKLWGFNAMGYHATNIVLHALNALMLWRILNYFGVSGAWFIALIFGVHPVHVESVAWITERKNLLSGFFYLFSLERFFAWASQARGRVGLKYFTSLILFVCALLSKTVSCSLPAVLLILLWWRYPKITWRRIAALLPFFSIGGMMAFFTVHLELSHVGAIGPDFDFSILERIIIATKAFWFYIFKLFYPFQLSFIYPKWQIDSSNLMQYGCLILLIMVLACLFVTLKKNKSILISLALYTIVIFPALGFFNIYPMLYSFVADHFQYLASIPIIAMVVAWTLSKLSKHCGRTKAYAAIAVLVIGLGALTQSQAQVYQSPIHLYKDTLKKNPGSWMAHNNLGLEYAKEKKWREAINHFNEALRIRPQLDNAMHNLGLTYDKMGDLKRAKEYYEKTIAMNPTYALSVNALGVIMLNEGDVKGARAKFVEALEIAPDYSGAHLNMGLTYEKEDDLKKAYNHYVLCLNLREDFAEARIGLAAILVKWGKAEDAIQHLLYVIKWHPNNIRALNNLGTIYFQKANFKKSYEYCQKALQIDAHFLMAKYNVALSALQLGRKDEAIRILEEIVATSPHYAAAAKILANIQS